MSTIVLNYLTSFLSMRDQLLNTMEKELNNVAQSKTGETEEENHYANAASNCRCCGWKGKFSQTQKNYFFLGNISEIESFCPKCHTYLGFISDKAEA